ncbi:MBL fold metallo-hydrolase [Nocardia sp. CDC160]|uniref:MBL fold metallo-hydrolase n=1 Tax=Nocardia sp. CDC160 TaxID=3112166 RepID=UPI002DB6149B|nr:MBL fold metallo-hydrolase [Nocardia sp. CDC160]MEC3915965.1 MBL fold metallo-hydrolase [Nocardia sp. CDC160]
MTTFRIPFTATTSMTGDARLRRPARMRSIRLGQLRVTYIPDGSVALKPHGALPAATDRDWTAHADYLDLNGNLPAGIGGLLIESGDRALLIDAGIGPVTVPDDPDNPLIGAIGGGSLLEKLARVGRTPDQIEAVAFTHLHVDHLGWAHHPVPGSTAPAFKNADYFVTAKEWEHRHLAEHGVTLEMLTAMVPKVRIIDEGQEVFPGVHALVIPGHTAGHTAFVITSEGERLLAFGDALHSPLQVRHPHWASGFDHDPDLAERARRHVIDELAATGDLGFGIHFADVVFGTVAREADDTTCWVPLP